MSTTDLTDVRVAWDAIATGYDRTNTPSQMWLGHEGLQRAGLRAGMRFVDVAAGSGALSIPAARLGADVLATDLSAAMLSRLEARARQEGLSVQTRVMDGHALDLDDDSYDVAGSQFGVMLFPDMPRGVRELARVVKPGGRVLITAYGNPHEIEFLDRFVRAVQAVRPSFEGPSMTPVPLPFQLQDPERLRRELATAGLHDVNVDTISERTEFRSGEHFWDWLVHSNPIVGAILDELALGSDEIATVRGALGAMIAGRGVLTAPANIGTGVSP
jgi:ubiquinone/menaquinone biosynthesis C-methylase UbiE